jgi:hypothetical protein
MEILKQQLVNFTGWVMEKGNNLTIEQLIPYVPFDLTVEVLDYKSDYVGRRYDKVVGIHQWDKSGNLWSVLTCGGAKPSVDRVRPALYPFEFLVKEIEHQGRKFVPMYELARLAVLDPWEDGLKEINLRFDEQSYGKEANCWVKVWDYDWEFSFDKQGFRLTKIKAVLGRIVEEVPDAPLNQSLLWQKLAEWHIDFQDLIGKGLAVSKLEI